jgi:hypothetical protein
MTETTRTPGAAHKLLDVFIGKWINQGNISTHQLSFHDASCTWTGTATRCTAVFTDNGTTQTAHRERLDEHGAWVPAMDVTLIKVL